MVESEPGNPLGKDQVERSLAVFGRAVEAGYDAELTIQDGDAKIEAASDVHGNVRGVRSDFDDNVISSVVRINERSQPEPEIFDRSG